MPQDNCKIGDYRVERWLQRSNVNCTALVVDEHGAKFALRGVKEELIPESGRLRLKHEVAALRNLNGRTFSRPLDSGVAEGWSYVTYRWNVGTPLSKSIVDNDLPKDAQQLSNTVLQIAVDCLEALQLVHEVGCIHRDLRPSHIISTPNGRYILGGYGPQCIGNAFGNTGTQALEFASFASPELAGSIEHDLTPASDLYSLGLVLYSVLNGHPPYVGDDLGAILFEHLTHIPSYENLPDNTPGIVLQFINRLLEKEVRDRYQTAQSALADAIQIKSALGDADALSRVTIGRHDTRSELTEPSFVGRSQEMEAIQKQIDSAGDGNHETLIAVGKSGMGKSRLLLEAIRLATQRGFSIHRSVASDQATQAPMGPLLSIVDGLAQQLSFSDSALDAAAEAFIEYRGEIATAMPSLARVLGWKAASLGGPEELGQGRVTAAFCRVLGFAAFDRPALLCIDDCQWLDKPSLRVLEEFVRTKPENLLLLIGSRPNEGVSEQVRAALPDATLLEFGELEHSGISDLIESMAGFLPDSIRETVVTMASGSPFMATAAMRGLVESGALVPSDEGWHVNDEKLASFETAGDSANILLKRLEFVDQEAIQVLNVGAVIGKQFDIQIPLTLTGLAYEEAFQKLARVRDQGLIWMKPDGKLAFVHDKIREAVVAGIHPESRRELHEQVANYLQIHRPENCFDLAYHFDAAKRPELAWNHALEAAEQAKKGYALDSAEAQYRIATRALDLANNAGTSHSPNNVVLDPDSRFAIESGLADVLLLLGKYAEADQWLKSAIDSAPSPNAIASVRLKQGDLAFKRGDKGEAMTLFEQALRDAGQFVPNSSWQLWVGLVKEILVQVAHSVFPSRFQSSDDVPTDSDRMVWRMYSKLAHCYWYVRDKNYTLWAHLRELNLAERYAETLELAQAYSEHAPVMSLIPWQSRGLDYAKRSLRIRTEHQDLWGQGQSRNFLSIMFYSGAKFEECLNQAQQAVSVLERTGDFWEVHMAQYQAAASMYRLGELKEAAASAKALYESAVRRGDDQSSGNAIDLWARASMGRVPKHIVRTEILRDKQDHQGQCHLFLAEGVQHHEAGRYDEAIQCFRSAVKAVQRTGVLNAYITPNYPWLATSLRRQFESNPPKLASTRFRAIRRMKMAAYAAVWVSLRFRNDLPHALRELAANMAIRGKARRAIFIAKQSIAVAEKQGAVYEAAQSSLLLAQLRYEFYVETDETKKALDDANANLETILETVSKATDSTALSLVDRFQTLLDAGRNIIAATNHDAILERTQSAATKLLRGDRVLILSKRQDEGNQTDRRSASRLEIVHPAGSTASFDPSLVEKAERKEGATTSTQERVYVHGIANENTGAFLVSPIAATEDETYFLYVANTHVSGIYGSNERRIANYLTSAASGAFERANGYEKLEKLNESLEQRVKDRTEAVVLRSEELERTANELRETQVELETARDLAEKASASKSSFLACMSHEIRTPMSAILGFTEILRTREINANEQQKYLRRIHTNGSHLLNLLNEVLDFSKIEADRLEIELLSTDPYELISDAIAALASQAETKKITLSFEAIGSFPERIETDPTRLRQIILNLVGNALKFTTEGGVTATMQLDSSAERPYLQIDIRDTGIGISEEQQRRIFTPFTQADASTTRQFGGTGLGLSISKRLAEALGGGIEISSVMGEGSTFSVRIAVGDIDEVRMITAAEAEQKSETVEPACTEVSLVGRRILVVDDVDANRELVGYLLHEANAEVQFAVNGQEALDIVATTESPFHLILMDMQMPVLDGYAATRELRRLDFTAPIVALTANNLPGDREKCLRAGCDTLVEKPIDFDHLLSTVSNLTAPTVTETCEVIRSVVLNGSEPTEPPQEKPSPAKQDAEDDSNQLESMMARLGNEYIRELEQNWNQFELAIQNEDLEDLQLLVHTAKGTSGTFGLDDIEQLMREIEDAILADKTEHIASLLQKTQHKIADAARSSELFPQI
ncbi:MAG: ATP-binding protein [Aureliella sp.]